MEYCRAFQAKPLTLITGQRCKVKSWSSDRRRMRICMLHAFSDSILRRQPARSDGLVPGQAKTSATA